MMNKNTSFHQIETGDNHELIKTIAENSIDAVVTDPPYGLASPQAVDIRELLQCWLSNEDLSVEGSGFMGQHWDAIVPQPSIWRECLRVLKPGGHLLAFGGTRTYDLIVMGLRLAGFEIRDQLAWVYGSGMNKVGYITDSDGKQIVAGWGGALRPAHEPIVVARKPFVGTLTHNLTVWGMGALNIDACRIEQEVGTGPSRWPTNFLHDGSAEVLAAFPSAPGQLAATRGDNAPMHNAIYGAMKHGSVSKQPRKDSTTSAARFFYSPKASRKDRNEGLTDKNTHVTVKPTELMRYLCRLVTPRDGIVLDPFAGSGSTGKAAILEGFSFIGFELDATYAKLAQARVEHAAKTRASHLLSSAQLSIGFEDQPPAAA